MMDEPQPDPAVDADLQEEAARRAWMGATVFSCELKEEFDYSLPTLELLDRLAPPWCKEGRMEEGLLADGLIFYTGEVLRRQYGGHWAVAEDGSLQLILAGLVAVSPVALAYACIREPGPAGFSDWHSQILDALATQGYTPTQSQP